MSRIGRAPIDVPKGVDVMDLIAELPFDDDFSGFFLVISSKV